MKTTPAFENLRKTLSQATGLKLEKLAPKDVESLPADCTELLNQIKALSRPMLTGLWLHDPNCLSALMPDDHIARIPSKLFRESFTLEQAIQMDKECDGAEAKSPAFEKWLLDNYEQKLINATGIVDYIL